MSGDFRSTTQITLYLNLKVKEKDARKLRSEIKLMTKVQNTDFVSRHDALESFRQSSGFGKSIDTLSSNPLPHTIIVEPDANADTFAVKNLLNALQAMPEVEIAKLDTEWLERLYTILEIAKRSVVIITALFACAVLLIIGNTIRLDIQSRYPGNYCHQTHWCNQCLYSKGRFLYGGVWYGLLGGFTSWIIVEVGLFGDFRPIEPAKPAVSDRSGVCDFFAARLYHSAII